LKERSPVGKETDGGERTDIDGGASETKVVAVLDEGVEEAVSGCVVGVTWETMTEDMELKRRKKSSLMPVVA
jgi:hypothetical protein